MSLKKNFAYNIALTVSQLLFPMLTFPYITRILGPEKLGAVNFAQSYIGYFILFSILGISVYGQREIAIHRNDINNRSKSFCNIITIHICTTTIMGLIYFITLITFDRFMEYPALFWMSIIHLAMNIFSIEWYFSGMENFKYITMRSVIIRSLFVIAIFLFIKKESDFILYYLLIILSTIIPFAINIIYAKKQLILRKEWITKKSLVTTLKGLQSTSYWFILTSFYGLFPIMFLGFVQSNEAVGNYTAADKLYKILISFFTAISAVMLPRMSAINANGNELQFKNMINKILTLFIPISLFMTIGVMITSNDLITIFAGNKFDSGGIALRILSPLIFLTSLDQIFIIQALFPMKKEKEVLLFTTISATTSILLNIFIVPRYSITGTAISMLFAELIITSLSGILCMRLLQLRFPIALTLNNLIGSILLFPLYFLLGMLPIENKICLLILFAISGIILFYILQIHIFKNKYLIDTKEHIMNKTMLFITR